VLSTDIDESYAKVSENAIQIKRGNRSTGHAAQQYFPLPLANLFSRSIQNTSQIEASTTEKAVMEKVKNEPRAKTYSYYYFGRKVWYIPLFFTTYFSIYMAAIIIRSIGRHAVCLIFSIFGLIFNNFQISRSNTQIHTIEV
jgi:hypothetical protein